MLKLSHFTLYVFNTKIAHSPSVQTLTPARITHCVTLPKLLYISEVQLPYLQTEITPTSQGCYKN